MLKLELRVTDWIFFTRNTGCFSDRDQFVVLFFLRKPIIYIFRCESPWCFYFPLNAFPRNISFQEVRYFVGVVWNPQEVPSNVLLFVILLFVISGCCFCGAVVYVHEFCSWLVQIAPTSPSCVLCIFSYYFFSCCDGVTSVCLSGKSVC